MKISVAHLSAFILVTGISGAGKSSAIDVLSDLGFFAVLNLPLALLRDFIELSHASPERFNRTALALDLDTPDKVAALLTMLKEIETGPCRHELIFLDCETNRIINRYNETRRPHPGFNPLKHKTLEEAVEHERESLWPVAEISNLIIDTTRLNIHDLKRGIKDFVDTLSAETHKTVRVNFVSFGFKYGIPADCDLIVDVRFLPNPYFVDTLREKSGLEPEVKKFVLDHDEAKLFVDKYCNLLDFLLPRYVFEGKSYLNVGIGCTGGRHRSVVLAEEFYNRITPEKYIRSIKHRDISRGSGLEKE